MRDIHLKSILLDLRTPFPSVFSKESSVGSLKKHTVICGEWSHGFIPVYLGKSNNRAAGYKDILYSNIRF